jgi:hypothetical protein
MNTIIHNGGIAAFEGGVGATQRAGATGDGRFQAGRRMRQASVTVAYSL